MERNGCPKDCKVKGTHPEKIYRFAIHFAHIYLAIMEEYASTYIEGIHVKEGYWSRLITSFEPSTKKINLSFLLDILSTGIGIGIGISILKSAYGAGIPFIRSLGKRHHRKRVEESAPQILFYTNNRQTMAERAVQGGIYVFECFEQQLSSVETDLRYEKALDKAAEDAVHRAIDFFRNKNLSFTPEYIVQGVVKGRSKKYTDKTFPQLRHRRPGHLVKKGATEWNTSEMFSTKGILAADHKYYGNGRGRKTSQSIATYGYRRTYSGEVTIAYQLTDPQPVELYQRKIVDLARLMGRTFQELEMLKPQRYYRDFFMKAKYKYVDGGTNSDNERVRNESVCLPTKTAMEKPVENYVAHDGGRMNLEQKIARKFEEGHIVVLTGFSGIGKTELVKKYCHANRYDTVTILKGGASDFVENFNKAVAENTLFPDWKILYVIDDAKSEFILKEIHEKLVELSENKNNQIIITSINNKWRGRQGRLAQIPVEEWTEAEACEFVKKELNASCSTDQFAKAVVGALNYRSPLALLQACSFVNKCSRRQRIIDGKDLGVESFLELLSARLHEFITEDWTEDDEKMLSISLTVQRAVDRLEGDELAKNIIDFLCRSPIQTSLPRNDCRELIAADIDCFRKSVNLLNRYSIVTQDELQLQLHPLVHIVRSHQLKLQR